MLKFKKKIRYNQIFTFVLSTPSTKALVLSVARTVVFRNPSTYT